MARFKSVLSRLLVDRAGRLHKCQHNARHEVRKGEIRLKLTEGRTDEHFCRNCAIQMLMIDMARLQEILDDLQGCSADRQEAS